MKGMKKMTEIRENGLILVFDTDANGELYLLHFGTNEFDNSLIAKDDYHAYRAVEIQLTGESHKYHRGHKNAGTICGEPLKVIKTSDSKNAKGRIVEFILQNDKIQAVLHYQFFDGISAVRSWTDITNISNGSIGLEYVSSFSLCGIDKEGENSVNDKLDIMIPFNTWSGELAWQSFKPEQLGYNRIRNMQLSRILVGCKGEYSTNGYLPMGYLHNSDTDTALMWQVENHGPWEWEISDLADSLYLKISGPNESSHQFWKNLKPNEKYTACKCAVAAVNGGFDKALGEITKYRRKIVRLNKSDSHLPVIFNDYMKCMLCNATEEKLLPVIEKASQIGCEYFMLDAGWFCRDDWEKEGGEWYPDPVRFPNGIEKVMDFIREKGMKPGIWLEPEVVGEDSPMKDKYPEHFFFMRHGKRIKDNLRYMLDFRNKEVTDYLDKVVDRFYNDYGVRYLKLDHNMEVGVGTDVNSDSMCEGLVAHNNAFNAWLQGLFDRYSDLIIENCSSGGLRMTYGILDKCSIQSVTDQEDYRINGIVASKASTALLPEQAGIWIYPSADADKYEVTYNMVNAMLKRMHVSGAVAHLSDEGLNYMREGIAQYKRIRPYIKKSVPVYPIGLASFHDKWAAVGYKSEEKLFVSVWRRQTEDAEIVLPFDDKIKNAHIIYPDFNENSVSVQDESLKVYIGHVDSACVIEADIEKQ